MLFGFTTCQKKIEYVYVPVNIPVKERPTPMVFNKTSISVVTKQTLDEYIVQNTEDNGEFVAFCMYPRAYENFSLNIQEMIRYMDQQGSLLQYYEEMAIKDEE